MRELFLSRSGRFVWDGVGQVDGFVLTGPFDDFLSGLDEVWLAGVWNGLVLCLERNDIDPGPLTWGSGHPAYTVAAAPDPGDTPLGYFGWVMPAGVAPIWQGPHTLTESGERIRTDLQEVGLPLTIAGARIRSHVCLQVENGVDLVPIAPDDARTGLDLVVDHCTESGSEWLPNEFSPDERPLGRIAHAIVTRDRDALFHGLEAARAAYSPSGYEIVVRGFADNLLAWPPEDTQWIEPRALPAPNVVAIGAGLEVTLARDPFARPGWIGVLLTAGEASGWYERAHRDRIAHFRRDLRAVLAGGAGPATLTSLARASELVVGDGTASGHFRAQDGATVAFTAEVRHAGLSALAAALDGLL